MIIPKWNYAITKDETQVLNNHKDTETCGTCSMISPEHSPDTLHVSSTRHQPGSLRPPLSPQPEHSHPSHMAPDDHHPILYKTLSIFTPAQPKPEYPFSDPRKKKVRYITNGKRKRGIRLVSPQINHEGRGPRRQEKHIAAGPPLEWYNLPEGSKILALTVQDIDAPDPGPPEGFLLKEEEFGGEYAGIKEGFNDLKKHGWQAPKLPSHGHRIEFKLYALDEELNHGNKVTRDKVLEVIEGHVLG
ncbi:hypothetical protein CDL12_24848 [Handroanthus impetiginosus]|uniref:Uncharacterized protein n=1 Tax=Handroanthus impetiginosus TaxID=429701 RepID=A0A2G9GBH7_9LAMI|nr:hypothetical protein CDL12_24848 [Handroanthus impetiginosus]